MQGKPWKALIVYTQVDHDDGDGILGEEARFKKQSLAIMKESLNGPKHNSIFSREQPQS